MICTTLWFRCVAVAVHCPQLYLDTVSMLYTCQPLTFHLQLARSHQLSFLTSLTKGPSWFFIASCWHLLLMLSCSYQTGIFYALVVILIHLKQIDIVYFNINNNLYTMLNRSIHLWCCFCVPLFQYWWHPGRHWWYPLFLLPSLVYGNAAVIMYIFCIVLHV